MADPFPAVAEAAAVGEIADLFADIRATVGVRVVNLVWRHLATIDGALPWAWGAVRPIYLQGMADCAAVRQEAYSAALDSWPITVKNEAVLGCFGSSTRPALRRANRASLPRTMRPSLRLGIGLRAIGTASAAV